MLRLVVSMRRSAVGGERCQQVGLFPDRLVQRKLVAGQRMQTAALTVAFEQGGVVRSKKLETPLAPRCAPGSAGSPACLPGQAVAHVDADRQLVAYWLSTDHDQLGQQVDRQVVHAVVPEILQHPQGPVLPEPERPLTINCILSPHANVAVSDPASGRRHDLIEFFVAGRLAQLTQTALSPSLDAIRKES